MRVADQEAAIGRLTSALVGMAPLAFVGQGGAPAEEGESAPASGQRRSALTSQRMALVPAASSESTPRTDSPPSLPVAKARDAVRTVVPAEVASDERLTVEALLRDRTMQEPPLDFADRVVRIVMDESVPVEVARARMETPAETAARFAHHCHGAECKDWDCTCLCAGCTRALRGRTPAEELALLAPQPVG